MHGRRAKSSRSLSPLSRSWRTPLTFMVTPCAQISNTLVMITGWEHRKRPRPSSLYVLWLQCVTCHKAFESETVWSYTRMTRATQFFDFNIAATLISFILFGKWLQKQSKSKRWRCYCFYVCSLSIDCSARGREDGVLDEREISQIALRFECIASYLVLSTTTATKPWSKR